MSVEQAAGGNRPAGFRPLPIALGPGGRRLIRSAARVFNPLVLRLAGRRWMRILGVVHHHGRCSGRAYATPLGIRPQGERFLLPLTFGDESHWYQNVLVAGGCVITYRGTDHAVVDPEVVDVATARSAFPGYERVLFRSVGIQQFLRLRRASSAGIRTVPGVDHH